jgi:hypothetical protein
MRADADEYIFSGLESLMFSVFLSRIHNPGSLEKTLKRIRSQGQYLILSDG